MAKVLVIIGVGPGNSLSVAHRFAQHMSGNIAEKFWKLYSERSTIEVRFQA